MKNTNIENSNKIFVGGLACTTTLQSLQEYFEQFGPVKDCVLMLEKETGRSRGFGFVIMKHIYDIYKIFNIPNHFLDGKQIDCKKAVPKDKVAPLNKSKKRVPSQGKDISNETNPLLNNINLEPAIISSENKMIPISAPLMTSQCLTAPLKIKPQAKERIMNKLQTNSSSYFPMQKGVIQLRPSNLGERVQ